MSPLRRKSTGIVHSVRKFPLLYGLAWALFWAVIGTILVGLWAHYGTLQPKTVVISIYIVHGCAIFMGGAVASRHAAIRGWFYGGLTGLLYSLLMVIIGFVVYNTFTLDAPGLLRICILTLVGAFSGMIGVNVPYDH